MSKDNAEVAGATAAILPLPDWPLPMRDARVTLRALRADDVETFLGYRSDPEVAKYQGWSTMDASIACEFIKEMESVSGPRPGTWIQLGIALCESDLLIGDIGLWLSEDAMTAQIGYSCASQFQRQGLTSQAVNLLLDALVHYTPCEKVRAIVDSRNLASERLLIRLSFQRMESAMIVSGSSEINELVYARDLRGNSVNNQMESTTR